MFLTATAQAADVVLPRQSLVERDGSLTNGERRVQRFYTAAQPIEGTLPDWKAFANITRTLGGPKAKLSTAAVMQDLTNTIAAYAGMTYPKLAESEAQTPDIGSADQYYGGTAYANHGGTGVQWATTADKGQAPSVAAPTGIAKVAVSNDELVLIPVTELYNREPEFKASEALMATHIDAAYLALNENDAAARGIAAGENVTISFNGQAVTLVARLGDDKEVPAGTALFGKNLAETPAPLTPVAVTVSKVGVMA
jgi:NADH-quinone oxidoreductase subunit G